MGPRQKPCPLNPDARMYPRIPIAESMIGTLSGVRIAPDGRPVSQEEWSAKVGQWMPTAEDRAYVAGLMGRVTDQGQYANWISAPLSGINKQPLDIEYVRFN